MRMSPDQFVRQDRGPYLFDRWQWPDRVPTLLGDLIVELSASDDEPPPDAAMVATAEELAAFAAGNGDLLLDLIYGHYRHAEERGWLSFWGVPPELPRAGVLSQVESVELLVRRGEELRPEAVVFVNPCWDPEHKLELSFHGGRIVAVNDEPYVLDGDVLRAR